MIATDNNDDDDDERERERVRQLRAISTIWYIYIYILKSASVVYNECKNYLYLLLTCPVGLGCRIHWLHFCREVRPPPITSVLDMTLNNLMVELWGQQITPSLPSLSGPLWLRVVASDRFLSMGEIELNCVLMLNWITWNRTVLIFKLRTYAKLNCLK